MSKPYAEDPFVILLGAMLRAKSGEDAGRATGNEIIEQEKRGQRKQVNSSTLPQEMRGGRAAYEALGVTFGADVDDIFIEAILPDGWTKRATDHQMWSEVVDETGKVRIKVFYKAAFYDRSAHMFIAPD